MKLSNKTYDILKYVALIALPAIIAFYSVVAKVWGFPHTEEIVTTLAAFNTLLGALLQVSTHNYNKALGAEKEE